MTKATRWTVFIFVVLLAFATGTLFQGPFGQKQLSAQAATNKLDDTGWTGVGTTDPLANLHIADSSSAAQIRLESLSGNPARFRFLSYSAGEVLLQAGETWTAGSTIPIKFTGMFGTPVHMAILGNGNVGIGSSNPAEKLQVEGNIKLNGDITSDGEICIGSGC